MKFQVMAQGFELTTDCERDLEVRIDLTVYIVVGTNKRLTAERLTTETNVICYQLGVRNMTFTYRC